MNKQKKKVADVVAKFNFKIKATSLLVRISGLKINKAKVLS